MMADTSFKPQPLRQRIWRILRRWLAFNAVGLLGILVQLGMLLLLTGVIRLHYMLGTALAVESAVLHNFFWHEHWTWADRTAGDKSGLLVRLLRFNFSNGIFSLVGNLLMMRLLVGVLALDYFVSNLLAIATCSVFNFISSDRFVFRRDNGDKSRPCTS